MTYLICLALLIFFTVIASLILVEHSQYKRNPVPLMVNYDTNFGDVQIKYLHKYNKLQREQ